MSGQMDYKIYLKGKLTDNNKVPVIVIAQGISKLPRINAISDNITTVKLIQYFVIIFVAIYVIKILRNVYI